MELPADLKVNGKFFMHLSVRDGSPRLHTALLGFYVQSFGLDRVILRDEGNILTKPMIADALARPDGLNLEEVLMVRAGGEIEEYVANLKE